jgi:hypothetical protein
MIKEGQIYKTADVVRVVKRIIREDLVEFIYKGYKKTSLSKTDFYFIWGKSLIAEYPTWQEAINSKEFNGE